MWHINTIIHSQGREGFIWHFYNTYRESCIWICEIILTLPSLDLQIVLRLSWIQSWIIKLCSENMGFSTVWISVWILLQITQRPQTHREVTCWEIWEKLQHFPLRFWSQEILYNQFNPSSIFKCLCSGKLGELFGWSI